MVFLQMRVQQTLHRKAGVTQRAFEVFVSPVMIIERHLPKEHFRALRTFEIPLSIVYHHVLLQFISRLDLRVAEVTFETALAREVRRPRVRKPPPVCAERQIAMLTLVRDGLFVVLLTHMGVPLVKAGEAYLAVSAFVSGVAVVGLRFV